MAPQTQERPAVTGRRDDVVAAGARQRNWRVALSLSLIPGLGQVYNGQLRKAAFFLAATVLTIGPAVLLITAGERVGTSLLKQRHFSAFLLLSFASVLAFLVLFVLGLAFWASAAADARRSATDLSAGRPTSGRWWLFRL